MTYQIKYPVHIYYKDTEIGDQDGHLASCENKEIAETLVQILNNAGRAVNIATYDDNGDLRISSVR